MNDELYHYGVKGMRWGVRKRRDVTTSSRAIRRKENRRQKFEMQKERRRNYNSNVMAAQTINNAKMAVGSAAVALGSATFGSAATYALARKGEQKTAALVYKLSRQTFDKAMFGAKIYAGSAVVSGMMTRPDSMHDYLEEERRIKEKYRG